MLKRIFRLTDSKDFQTVYRRGRYDATTSFSVNILPAKTGQTKIGVVVNKKVAKKATDRNAIKRKVREALRLLLPELKTGQHIVVTVKKDSLEKEFSEIKKELQNALIRLKAIKDEKTTKDN